MGSYRQEVQNKTEGVDMTKWMLGTLLSIVLLFGGALMSNVQEQVKSQGDLIYSHTQDISTLKEAVRQQTEVQKETRDAVKELSKDIKDAFVPPTKRDY
jgi:septal ring factor EnvC (AmiA/AmiB activator)